MITVSRYPDVSARQATALIGLLLLTQSLVLAPSVMAEYAQQDMWISVMLSIIMTVLLAALTVWLSSRFPEYTVIQFSEKLLGRFFGKFVGILFFLYFVTITVTNVQLVSQVFKTMFMPLTPNPVFAFMIMAFAFYCSVQRVGTLARMSTILFIITFAIAIFVILFGLHHVRFIHYLPFLQNDWSNIFHASLFPFAFYGQVVTITMVYPYIRRDNQKNAIRIFIWGSFIACSLMGVMIMEFIGLFGAHQLQSFIIPASEQVSLIRIGEFFERQEIFFVTIWTSVMLVVTGFFFSMSFITMTQLFNHSESHWLRIMLGIMVFLLTMLFQGDLVQFVHFQLHAWTYISIVFQAGLPLLLGLIYLMKKRSGSHEI